MNTDTYPAWDSEQKPPYAGTAVPLHPLVAHRGALTV